MIPCIMCLEKLSVPAADSDNISENIVLIVQILKAPIVAGVLDRHKVSRRLVLSQNFLSIFILLILPVNLFNC